MKILQNKVFVIVLAVFAFGLVGRNLFWPLIKRSFPAKAAAAAPVAAAPAAKSAPVAASSPAAPASTADKSADGNAQEPNGHPMNLQEAWANAPQWSQSPKRDPFKMIGARSDGKSARDLLTLKGVLRQTESTLAVLNDQVLAAGDIILGFKIESVEDHCVWVSGPNGREQVEFKYSLPPAVGPGQRQGSEKDLSLADPQP